VEGAQGKPARKGGKRCTAGGRGKNYAKFQDILQSKKRKEAGTNQNTVGTGIKVYPPPCPGFGQSCYHYYLRDTP